MALLDAGHGRIASGRPGIEIPAVAGKRVFFGGQIGEIGVGGRMPDLVSGLASHERLQVGEVLPRGPAPVIPDPPEQDAQRPVGMRRHPVFDLAPGPAAARIVMGFRPRGQDFGAVIARPDESVGGKGGVLGIRAAEQVGRIAAPGQDLDKSAGVAERIQVGGGLDVHAEPVPEIALPEEDLADERFAARHVAVRLEEPAAEDVPLLGLDETPDAVEQLGLVFLDPLVEEGFVVAEDVPVVRFAESGRGPERGQRFARPFRPFP